MSIFSAQQIAEIMIYDQRETGYVYHSVTELHRKTGIFKEPYPVEIHTEGDEIELTLRLLQDGIDELTQHGYSPRQIKLFYDLYDIIVNDELEQIATQTTAEGQPGGIRLLQNVLIAKLAEALIDIQQSGNTMLRTVLLPENNMQDIYRPYDPQEYPAPYEL